MKKHRKKTKTDDKLKVNPELDGLDININSLGEIHSNISIEEINAFLNKNVVDKKLKEQEYNSEG